MILRKHVYRDLDPYICLHPDCSGSQSLFHDTNAWVQHMREHHLHWRCSTPSHAGLVFCSEVDFEEHLKSKHKGAVNEKQLQPLLNRAKRPGTAFAECPLCGLSPAQDASPGSISSPQYGMPATRKPSTDPSSEYLTKHVANHLLSLSLISLPWRDMADEEMQKEETVSHHANEDPASTYHDDMLSLSFGEDEDALDSGIPPNDLEISIPAIPDDAILGRARDEWSFLPSSEYFGHDRDPTLQTFLRKLYIESSPSMNDKEGPLLPCHFVPFGPSKNFHGRHNALTAIEEALLPESLSASIPALATKGETNPRTFAICGPGGMGKTQVAIEFVSRHRDKFDAVFWVHANDTSKLAQDFNEIALKLGLVSEGSADARDYTYTRELVKRWLVEPLKNVKNKESDLASWLLVYDGIEVSKTINDYWPYDGPGSVLITSRNPFSWTTCWSLVPFTPAEATDFLLKVTGRKGDAPTRAAVEAVSQRLGGLPLAL